MRDLRAELVITGVDKASGPISRVNRSLSRLSRASLSLRTFGSNLAGLGASVASITGVAGALAGLGAAVSGVGFARNVIDTTAQFERFQAVLETTEGSAGKAKTALDWVSDFAVKTPYELDEVTAAFVKLRAYGMSPTDGLLKTLGDTSSAMGKDLMQAVEAIADAVTGENERLKEFGIKAAVKGNKIAYTYTNAAGKQIRKIVDRNNRAMIQSTLEAIWNEKYQGAMERQSKTWTGVVSNISDSWTRFQMLVGDTGFFDGVKSVLIGINDQLSAMSDSGELKALAESIGGGMTQGLNAAIGGFKELINVMGGAKEAAKSIGEIFAFTGKVIGEISREVAALVNIFDRLTKVIPFLKSFASMPTLDGPLFNVERGGVADRAMKWLGIGDNSVAARERNKVTGEVVGSPDDAAARNRMDEARRGALVNGTRGRSATSVAAAASKAPVEVGGKVQIEVTAKDGAAARVTGVSSTNRSAPISVDQGLVLAGP